LADVVQFGQAHYLVSPIRISKNEELLMSDPKSTIALIPGVLEVHRLVKNLRSYLNSRKTTVGGVRRAKMSVDEAVAYGVSIFGKIDQEVVKTGRWNNKKVLEVGPGDSLATGLLCLSRGAASYCAVDRFQVGMDIEFERQVFRKLFESMTSEQQENCRSVVEQLGSTGTVSEDRFVYRNNLPVEDAPKETGFGPFDVIFSNAVLEHVADLPGTLRAFSQLLSSSGIMLHEVDLRSHQTYEKHPLQFLEYPQWLWRMMSSHNGEPNRWRLPHYCRLLKENGIDPVEISVTESFDTELIELVRPKLCSMFKAMKTEDLRPAVFRFYFTRDRATKNTG
jgi:SAM-dependent methyltransferase